MRKKSDDVILAALLTNSTVKAAAAAVGISEKTIFNRLADPAFRQRLSEQQAAALLKATTALSDGTTEAVAVLLELCADDITPAAIRANAASTILREAARYVALVDFEARLSKLEAAQEANQ